MSIPVTLTRAFLDRLDGTLALMNGPHQRMTQSRPSGSWHGTHGPRITNWGPNRGRPTLWHTVIYIDPSLRVSFSLSIPSWICDRLISSSLAVYQICSNVTCLYIASASARLRAVNSENNRKGKCLQRKQRSTGEFREKTRNARDRFELYLRIYQR